MKTIDKRLGITCLVLLLLIFSLSVLAKEMPLNGYCHVVPRVNYFAGMSENKTCREKSTGMEFAKVSVSQQCYLMGNTHSWGRANELPVHNVCLLDYIIGVREVTVAQFNDFMRKTGYKPDADKFGNCQVWVSRDKFIKVVNIGPSNVYQWFYKEIKKEDSQNMPALCISWNDAKAYINWMNRIATKALEGCSFQDKDDKSKKHHCRPFRFRLPTEAEWEYACKGPENYLYGTGSSNICSDNDICLTLANYNAAWPFLFAQYVKDYNPLPRRIETVPSNSFGLVDMSGNAWEWTEDFYSHTFYRKSPRENPVNKTGVEDTWKKSRTIRGGAWYNSPDSVTCTRRIGKVPNGSTNGTGFRVMGTPYLKGWREWIFN